MRRCRRPGGRGPAWSVLASVALVTAGCGSNLPPSQLVADEFGGGTTRGVDGGPSGQASADGQSSSTGPGGGASSSGRVGGSAGAGGSGSGGSGGPGARGGRPPAGPGSHGVTDTTIEVGLWTFNSEALNATTNAVTGQAPSDAGDPTKGAQAVVAAVNARGGVAGRSVVPRLHLVDIASLTTRSGREREAQRACAAWTEDRHVFAMMQLPFGQGLDCAVSTNTVYLGDMVHSGAGFLTESTFRKARNVWYGPNQPLAERRDRGLVESLAHQGYFPPGARVAVFVEDAAGSKESYQKALRPALAAKGVTPVLTIEYPEYFNSPWDNYILQLQEKQVTHAIWSSSNGGHYPAVLAMRAAENQQYQVQWALSSDQWPGYLIGYGAPAPQLATTRGMGWLPTVDIQRGDATTNNWGGSSNSALCKGIVRDSGQPTAYIYCEALFFLKAALDQSAEVSPAGMSAALAALGTGYPSVHTVGGASVHAPDRHDGPSVYRNLGYDSGCGQSGHPCFRYTGEARPLP